MEMNDFPLNPFLTSLAADGIYLTLRDYERIHLALQTGGPWTLTRLRDILLALLAKDVEQHELLQRRFYEFFSADLVAEVDVAELDMQQVLTDLRQIAAQRPAVDKLKPPGINLMPRIFSPRIEPPKVKVGFWTVWFALLAVGLVTISYLWFPRSTAPAEVLPPPTQVAELAATPVAQSRKRLYTDVPYVAAIRYEPLETFPLWQRYAGIATFFFFAALLYGLYLWRSHKIPEDEAPPYNPDGPRHFALGSIGGQPAPRLNDAALNELADAMGYFQSSEGGHRLNVVASIQTTMRKGGTPALEFYRRHQLRSLLILEDAFAEALTWNPLARELAEGIARLGVSVTYGRFYGSPTQFKTPDGVLHRLEDLEDQRQGYLLLLFTDGKSFHHQEHNFVLEELAHWPMIAWLDLREPRAWDETAALPVRYGIPLYPATPAGVRQAVRSFLTEHGATTDYGINGRSWPGLPSQAGIRIDAHVEQLLGDALLWAQDCAMLQPVTPGLADGLRRTFHRHLPAERIERLYALPGTQFNDAGLRFSNEVLRVLRRGFLTRRTDAEQEAVLRFLLREIGKAEPSAEDSPAHLAWEAVRERVRLEVEQDAALARLAQLAKTPIGAAISASLENFGFREQAGQKIPLRLKPNNQYAWQRLARIADSFQIPKLEAYPIASGHRLALAMLVGLFLSFVGMSVRHLLLPSSSYENIKIVGSPTTLDETYFQLKVKVGETGLPPILGKIQVLDNLPLLTTNVYSLTVYGSGHSSIEEIIPRHHHRMIICVKTFNETETCPKDLLQESTTQDEDAIEAENKAKLSVDCRIELPGIGLTIERCPFSNAQFITNDSDEVVLDSWRKKLGSGVPNQRMMSIGLEVSLSRQDHPTLRRLRSKLLETSSVDVIYRIHPDNYGNWHTDEIIRFINHDFVPLIEQSQLIWWTVDPIPDLIDLESSLPQVDRILRLCDEDNLVWLPKLEKLFEPGYTYFVTEMEILQACGKVEPGQNKSQVVLVRPVKSPDAATVQPAVVAIVPPTTPIQTSTATATPTPTLTPTTTDTPDSSTFTATPRGTLIPLTPFSPTSTQVPASPTSIPTLALTLTAIGTQFSATLTAGPVAIFTPTLTRTPPPIPSPLVQPWLTSTPTLPALTVGATDSAPESAATITATLLAETALLTVTANLSPTITPRQTISFAERVIREVDGSCQGLDLAFLQNALKACSELNENWVCYGGGTVKVTPNDLRFYEPRDRQPINIIKTIDTGPDGIVVMSLRIANSSSPLRVVLYGENSFAVVVAGETLMCNDILSGLLVQTQDGETGMITVNGIEIVLH